jgi:hypothetical protein
MKQLQALSVVSPGFYGLNTQESGITLSSNYAQVTDNVVIDKYGRLGSRKGWQMRTTSGVTQLAGEPIKFLMEHINADNTAVTISGGNSLLLLNGADVDTFIDITPAAYTVTGDNWKGASLYDHALIVQDGHEPIVYTESEVTVTQTISDLTGLTQSYGTSYPKDVIGAYGRFWVHDGTNIYWTTDIADTAFPAFSGGTSGFLNIASVLPNNVDAIVALASYNGFLIVFCERNIVIYSGAENPLGDFRLHDVIAGVGCVARDSLQSTGNDLIFLSDTGIRSLGRVIQEKSLPMRDLTVNVRDDLLADLIQERFNTLTNEGYSDLRNVKSVYSELNAFYLISFPSTNTVYCLDMRQPLETGAARVTTWRGYQATAFVRRRDRELLIGKTNGIGRYFGYTDDGEKYRLKYFSHYLDMGAPTTNKILKQINATVIGGSNQSFVIKTNFDYQEAPRSYPFTIVTGEVAEFGVAEYGIGEYSFGVILDSIKSSVGGSGNTIQIGFEADVNGNELSVQKIDMFVKTGRMS